LIERVELSDNTCKMQDLRSRNTMIYTLIWS